MFKEVLIIISSMDNHYESLKLERSASLNDIKKAYRKLSYYNHPDRGGSIRKFSQILDAYAQLTNKRYKHTSSTFVKYYCNEKNARKCGNIVNVLDVTLEQIYNKERITKEIIIDMICDVCHGIGIVEKVKRCKDCDCSSSSRSSSSISGSDYKPVCSKCNSEGFVVTEECECTKCKGAKIVKKQIKFVIKLSASVNHGKCIIFYKRGNEYPNSKRGDVLFMIREQQHSVFKRINKYDLHMQYTINLVEAVSGFVFKFVHLDGRKLYADLQMVTKPGYKVVYGEGLRKGHSNLYVEFVVQFPNFQVSIYDRMQLIKIFEQQHNGIDFNPSEYEHCYVIPTKSPFKRDDNNDYYN